VTFVVYVQWKFGLNQPPRTSGDEPGYDSIAWELSQGRGFQLNYADPEFRTLYRDAAKENPELYSLSDAGPQIDVTRPPLYPLLIAATNKLFGRQLWGIRILDALAMAFVCGLAVTFLAARFGIVPGVFCAILFILVDTRTRLYGRAILSEATAAALIAAFCLCLVRYHQRPSWKLAMACGLCMGLSLLDRTAFTLWLPTLTLTIGFVAYRSDAGRNWQGAGLHMLLFGLTVIAVFAPWGVRNINVTGRFLPLGIQGKQQLSAAFSDYTWDARGLWVNLKQTEFYDSFEMSEELNPLEKTLAEAEFSSERAKEWILSNPLKAIALVPMKIYQEFRPRTIPELLLLVLSIVGGCAMWRRPEGKLLLAVVLANALAIGATWSVEGRFLVPMLFVQHVFAAFGGWWIVCPRRRQLTESAAHNIND
jgi:4-amino-4-deoxy-L-arabinose transferase-like glycosyltransferase